MKAPTYEVGQLVTAGPCNRIDRPGSIPTGDIRVVLSVNQDGQFPCAVCREFSHTRVIVSGFTYPPHSTGHFPCALAPYEPPMEALRQKHGIPATVKTE